MTLAEKITREKIPGVKVFENFDMTNRSTLKTKSVANLFLELCSLESLKALKILESEGKSAFPLGKGSNTLLLETIERVPYSLKGDFCQVEVTNSQVFCGTGATLSSLFQKAYKNSLAGLESLSLIPGTVGGALRMNAGCYGREISQLLESVIFQNSRGEIFSKENLWRTNDMTSLKNPHISQKPREEETVCQPFKNNSPNFNESNQNKSYENHHHKSPCTLQNQHAFQKSNPISTPQNLLGENSELNFSYRNCDFFRDKLSLFAEFSLESSDKSEILKAFKSFKDRKNSSQPTQFPSLGSVFKRKGDFLPAKAIDRLGLKGERVGGMAVSEKHSGFIVNLGGGTAKDFLKLVEKIEDIVYNIDKVILEREFEILT